MPTFSFLPSPHSHTPANSPYPHPMIQKITPSFGFGDGVFGAY